MTLGDTDIPIPSDDADCLIVREILDRVADKWSLYVIMSLKDGPVRFNELRRRISGVSQRMLTLTLRGLEQDGIINRTLYPTIPPRVDYDLTALGRTLIAPVMTLVVWADKNRSQIEAARSDFLAAQD